MNFHQLFFFQFLLFYRVIFLPTSLKRSSQKQHHPNSSFSAEESIIFHSKDGILAAGSIAVGATSGPAGKAEVGEAGGGRVGSAVFDC